MFNYTASLKLWLSMTVVAMPIVFGSFSPTAEPDGQSLKGLRVAVLVTDGFEQSELMEPRKALLDAGAEPKIISPAAGQVRGWKNNEWGDRVDVNVVLDTAKFDQFDALLLPGGVINPDRLRMIPRAVAFVRAFADAGKPVAAICHGPWLLVEADVVRGRRLTSWPSLKTDIKNAGGAWEDGEVIVDRGLITSRKPEDIPAFNRRMIAEFAKARNKVQ